MKKYKSPLRTIDGKPLDQFTAQAAERILLNRVQEELAQPAGSVKSAAAIWGMRIDHFHDWYKRLTGNSPMSDREKFLKAAERERLKAATVPHAVSNPQTGSHPGPSPEASPAAKVIANSEIQVPSSIPATPPASESPDVLRQQKAASLFRDTELSMAEVAETAGFKSIIHMRNAFNGFYEPPAPDISSPKTKTKKAAKPAASVSSEEATPPAATEPPAIAHKAHKTDIEAGSLEENLAATKKKFAAEARRHLDNPDLSLKDVAALFHMTPSNFGMKYEDATGETPRRYRERMATQEAKAAAPQVEKAEPVKTLKAAHDEAATDTQESITKPRTEERPVPSLESVQIGKQLLMDETISVEDVAKSVGMTKDDFESVFQIAASESPQEYRLRIFSNNNYPRLQAMLDLLKNTKKPETGIAAECGYASQEEFQNAFEAIFDITPEDYRTELALNQYAAQLRGASGGAKLKGSPNSPENPGERDDNAIAEEIKTCLLATNHSLKYIAEDLGLKDANELNNIFRAATGIAASTFRMQARDLSNFTLDKLKDIPWDKRIETAKRFFHRIDITPEEIWKPLGYKSSYAFLNHFRQETGDSCATYYSQVSRDRLVNIEQLFITTTRSVADIAEEMGFSSSARLRKFLSARGTTPETLKARAVPEQKEDPAPK